MNYAAPHVWNLVAKVLREFEIECRDHNDLANDGIQATREIANRFADRFEEKDIGFDRRKFLNQCDSFS